MNMPNDMLYGGGTPYYETNLRSRQRQLSPRSQNTQPSAMQRGEPPTITPPSSENCLPDPYPPAKATQPNHRYEKMIRSSYSGRESELTAIFGYVYQSMIFKSCNEEYSNTIMKIAICEMHHMELLGELLISMGSDPKFYSCLPPNANPGGWWSAQPMVVSYPKNLGEAIKGNIKAEKAAYEEYINLANYIDDLAISALLRRIAQDEKLHIKILEELYSRFCS